MKTFFSGKDRKRIYFDRPNYPDEMVYIELIQKLGNLGMVVDETLAGPY